jgi:outer membrane lipoprotein-sorting protein
LRRSIFIFAVGFSVSAFSPAQEILTADRFLANVGERYGKITDYQAKIVITTAKAVMKGTIMFKTPQLMRLDFSQPEEQVISFNGDTLTVYLPEYRAVLSQNVTVGSKTGGATLASPQGLTILRRNYMGAYSKGPDPVPLDPGSAEKVIKLSLSRQSLSEGFRELQLSISGDSLLIRRIDGRTIADETVRFDFTDIVVNQGLPDARFVYDSPASANLYNNFLFKDSD